VLVGENPSTFTIAAAPWQPGVPEVPGVIPAQVLERRPDVATAERQVAAANAAIGIQRAAFFPNVALTGSTSTNAATLGKLFTAGTSFWSLGASAAETLLDFGARRAKVAEARAAYAQTVANYRQSVLTAFQQVEDDLAAISAYRAEVSDLQAAAEASRRAETVALNQYKAGTVDYTTVVTAQTTNYSAQQKLIQTTVLRQTTAVAIIQAIGGEWRQPLGRAEDG
jgi:NodT family efflux transporter outer membrane factor (OMF) lipoprotein